MYLKVDESIRMLPSKGDLNGGGSSTIVFEESGKMLYREQDPNFQL